MQAPGGIPNGLHGQRMYPYEVPSVAPKPTPFDQVNPNLSRIPQTYRDDPFFKQGWGFRPNNSDAGSTTPGAAPSAGGPNPPPVYVTPPGGNSVLVPPSGSTQAPLLLQPGTTVVPQGTLPPGRNVPTSPAGRNVPTPAPGGQGYPVPPTGSQQEDVIDPPPKLDSPEPSDPRSIYGPLSSAPRQLPPYGVAPVSYGPGGPNGGPFVSGGAPSVAAAPRTLPPQYGGPPQGASQYDGGVHDPMLRTPPSSYEIR
jgi:hypothetical protein